jgi:two-component system chemotaxis response regulator CheB
VELFGPLCSVDVQEADDKVPARGGSIYFAPPDYHLLIEAGPQLSLSVDEPVHFSRPSIDVLFESAAEVFGPRLLGILLSGASEDGSAGLGAIARAGGITAVQDPACAQSPLMVESALSRVRVDAVEDLHGLAGLLMTTTRYPRTLTKPELP